MVREEFDNIVGNQKKLDDPKIWSVRKNLPGDVSIKSIKEIEYKDLKGSKFTICK